MAGSALNVAILGANGQIGKGLIDELSEEFRVHAVVRNIQTFENSKACAILTHDQLPAHEFALVVNAAGPGDPQLQRALGPEMFRITEMIDERVLQYLDRHPATRYLFVSTGDVHRFMRSGGMTGEKRSFVIPTGEIASADCYALAKLYTEIKHRALRTFKIWDIRVFGYFSRHMAPDRTFFLSQLRTSLAQRIPFRTHGTDFVRDYISFDDLASLIRALLRTDPANQALDLFSAMPLTKFELLEACETRYGLQVEIEGRPTQIQKMVKSAAISQDTAAAEAGHVPLRTSMETVLRELDHLFAT